MAKSKQATKKAAVKGKAAKPAGKASAKKATPTKKAAKKAAPKTKAPAKPVKKANSVKKSTKPVAKKAAKPVAKKASKPIAKKAAKPITKKTAKPVAKKTSKAASKKAAKPVAKKAAKAPAKKAQPKTTAKKPVAKKPEVKSPKESIVKTKAKKVDDKKKVALKPEPKKLTKSVEVKTNRKPIASKKGAPKKVQELKPAAIKKQPVKTAPVITGKKTMSQKPIVESLDVKKKALMEEKKPEVKLETLAPQVKSNINKNKIATKGQSEKKGEKRQILSDPNKITVVNEVILPKLHELRKAAEEEENLLAGKKQKDTVEKTRYSDAELQEFKDLILEKLKKAKDELKYLQDQISRNSDIGSDDSDMGFKGLEDGTYTAEREYLSQMASRQLNFISHLDKALMRIENKTYGICRETGKLISKERLKAVPHATLSIEAKSAKG